MESAWLVKGSGRSHVAWYRVRNLFYRPIDMAPSSQTGIQV